VEVLISTDKAGDGGDLASLRAWLDATGVDVPWELAPERPASGTLGLGVDGICTVIAALEGLPPLIQWIKSWRESKQESPLITLTITIPGSSPYGNTRNNISEGEPAFDDTTGGEAGGHDHEPDA
jgi:membrane-associated two-gene conflict system component 1 (EACC1)